MSRPVAMTREEARELKKRSEKLERQGGGMSHALVRKQWLQDMERELRAMVRGYDGSARKARELLEALLIAEQEGVAAVRDIRRQLASRMNRKRAA